MSTPFRTLISARELADRSKTPNLLILDCRFSLTDPAAGQRAYGAGHIPGAHYLHLERDLSSAIVPGKTGRHPLPDPELLANRLGALGADATTQLVGYDDAGGAMAARLWWLARWLGHDDVAVLDGGYPAWLAEGLPITTEVPSPSPKRFVATLRSDLSVEAADVARALAGSTHLLFDARAEERYRGDVEPIDPVAGHIPSARCVPFSQNLEGGYFRSPAELRQRFETELAGVPADKAIVYCGSGVTACHDILAAAHAGLHGMKLYAGSWSEWITDPNRPVARGD